MRAVSVLFAVAALSGLGAFGQTTADPGVDKVLRFTSIDTPAGYQEVANALRMIPEIVQLQVVASTRSVALHGTTAQIALAEWLFNLLDRPAGSQTAANEYHLPGSSDVARVFYLAPGDTAHDIQELVNTVRTIPEINRAIQCQTSNAIVLRGSPDQAAAAEWLLQQLDGPAPKAPGVAEYTMPGVRDSAIRVFSLAHTPTPAALQEITNATRTIVEIPRVMIRGRLTAMVVRGTPDQAAAAAWLIDQLDRPAGPSPAAPNEYRMAGTGNSLTRVFYLANAGTPQHMQELINAVRTTTQINRAILCSTPRALALRGSDSQIAMAENLIKQLDQ